MYEFQLSEQLRTKFASHSFKKSVMKTTNNGDGYNVKYIRIIIGPIIILITILLIRINIFNIL